MGGGVVPGNAHRELIEGRARSGLDAARHIRRGVTLALGLSHQVNYTMPKSVSARVETIDEGGIKRPRLHLASFDKEALGQTAARIRSFRKPEPYKGKGVRYTGEKLREKAGKAGGKK